MGNGKGLGLVALLGLAFLLLKDREVGAGAFYPTFEFPKGPSITYTQYFDFATAPEEEVEADPLSELTISSPITKTATKTGFWRTIGGKIPTPSGGLIPLPTVHVGRTAVETKLQPIEEAVEEPHFQDVAGRRSVNLRLQPL